MLIGFWFKSELKDFIKEILLSVYSLKRAYFKPDAMRGILDEHFASKKGLFAANLSIVNA